MKVNEIRELGIDELESTLKNLKAELFNLRFQNATNQLENPIKIAEARKSIARVMTVMREKQVD